MVCYLQFIVYCRWYHSNWQLDAVCVLFFQIPPINSLVGSLPLQIYGVFNLCFYTFHLFGMIPINLFRYFIYVHQMFYFHKQHNSVLWGNDANTEWDLLLYICRAALSYTQIARRKKVVLYIQHIERLLCFRSVNNEKFIS